MNTDALNRRLDRIQEKLKPADSVPQIITQWGHEAMPHFEGNVIVISTQWGTERVTVILPDNGRDQL
jgi:hypothetical protein